MISTVALARSYSARLALNVVRSDDPSSNASESNSPAARLLSSLNDGGSDATSLSTRTLSILLQALQNRAGNSSGSEKPPLSQTGIVGSKGFMTALKDKLSSGGDDPMSYVNNQQMLKALKDGTLKVTNPATGETVSAYDPADGKQHSTKAETGDPKAWNKFLQEHLKRDSNGNFAKSADGSYIDAQTGENAYFDKVGGSYYYLTWPGKVSANV